MVSPKDKKTKLVQEEDWGKVILMDSVAQVNPDILGQVVVAGSHGAAPAARHAAQYLPFGLILNDAGRGRNDAGISGLAVLDGMGILGAAVDCMTGRIGEGEDNYESGIISAVNERAGKAGIRVGMTVVDAARLMLSVKKSEKSIEGAYVIHEDENGCIVLTDTVSHLNESHRETVVVGGSHCAHTTYDFVKGLDLKGIFLNDAGKGKDGAGISGLPIYQTASIPAGAVDCMTAMIGHGLDAWENGIVSSANGLAQGCGVAAGMQVRVAALKILKAAR